MLESTIAEQKVKVTEDLQIVATSLRQEAQEKTQVQRSKETQRLEKCKSYYRQKIKVSVLLYRFKLLSTLNEELRTQSSLNQALRINTYPQNWKAGRSLSSHWIRFSFS